MSWQRSLKHIRTVLIAIDDFKVPGRPDIPYDFYGTKECSFEYIKENLEKVFSEYSVHYIIPKQTASRAKFVADPEKNGNDLKLL